MSKLTDKASYLKGLAAGMKLNMEKDANQLLVELIDMVSDMASEMETMAEAFDELNEYVESIDDDLADLEETLFGDDEDDECRCHDCDCEDGDCECCHDHDEDDEDDELISYACPSCGHEIEFRASDVDFDEDYLCPACGKPVFPELEEEDDEEEDEE